MITFSLEDDGEFDLLDLWEQKNKEFGTIEKGENPTRDIDVPKKTAPENPKNCEINKMPTGKITKKHIFIIAYIILLIIELFFFVPYEEIEIFLSQQNVPHTEVVGNGYTTMWELIDKSAYSYDDRIEADRVNTSQVLINLTFTTIVFAAIYFMFLHKKKDTKPKYRQISFLPIEPPTIDFNALAFADEATQQKAIAKYTADMFEYAQYRLEYESEDIL